MFTGLQQVCVETHFKETIFHFLSYILQILPENLVGQSPGAVVVAVEVVVVVVIELDNDLEVFEGDLITGRL